MSKIVVYDPGAAVVDAVIEYNPSANTPDYDSEPNKLVNPDLTLLEGIVPVIYWKRVGTTVVEMDQTEKETIDPQVPEVTKLNEGAYDPPTEDAGWTVDRGGVQPDASLTWNETTDQWEFGTIGNMNAIAAADHTHTESDITDLDNYAVIGGAHHDGFSDFVAQEHIRWDLTGAEDIHDNRIAQSSVTQHQGALSITENQISDLGNYAVIGGAHHDGFSDFVANEHINHTSVTLTAGSGLAGGGDISSNRSFSVNVQNSIEISTDTLQLVNDEASPGADQVYGTNGSGVKGWYDQPSGGSVFGDEYQKASSTGESSTTSTTYQTKLTLTATGLTSGYTYCISYHSMVGSQDDDKHMDARLTVGGTTYAEAENSGKTGSTSYWSFSGSIYLTGLSGSVDIDLDFREGGEGGTALMRQAYLQIWRVE